jgi:3-hydroxybutyryl-CoA dehydratase
MRPALAPGLYGLDDLAPGDWYETGETGITCAQIDAFAALTGDRFEIHMDDAAARSHGFPGRVAHGLLVLSLLDGLKNEAPVKLRAVASLGWDWSFRKPVFIGDRLRARIEVRATRPVKTPGRGILTLGFTASDAEGRLVQEGTNLLMMYR